MMTKMRTKMIMMADTVVESMTITRITLELGEANNRKLLRNPLLLPAAVVVIIIIIIIIQIANSALGDGLHLADNQTT